jgi:arylsulfatase A-like enzyme
MNVVCICLDTFRADIIGKEQPLASVETPNLDRFAAESVYFERAFGECQPTLQMRRAFFTGMRSFPFNYNFDRRGHWHHAPGWHKIPPHQDTLAEILLNRGYATGLISDTYHMFKPTMNYTRGFCSYEFIRGQETDNFRVANPAAVRKELERSGRIPDDPTQYAYLIQYLANNKDRNSEEDYLCAKVFRTAQRWLVDNADNKPFFLWVDAFDPHEPWDPPAEYIRRYYPQHSGADFAFPGGPAGKGPLSREQVERTKALYFGEVTFVDKWVGLLFETMTKLGLWDETIVMVLSDHGTQLMEAGRFGKGRGDMRPYNTRFVWYLRHPDGPRGKKITAYVQSHDVAPTALSLLGIPFSVEGKDAWPLVTEDKDKLRDHIVIGWAGWSISEFGGSGVGFASVRDDEWCYVVPVGDARERWEHLYHPPTDQEEVKDVSAENPEVVKLQRERVEAVMKQPLPGKFEELGGPAPSPGSTFISARYGKRQS